jgi:hypothetical protein
MATLLDAELLPALPSLVSEAGYRTDRMRLDNWSERLTEMLQRVAKRLCPLTHERAACSNEAQPSGGVHVSGAVLAVAPPPPLAARLALAAPAARNRQGSTGQPVEGRSSVLGSPRRVEIQAFVRPFFDSPR